VAANTATPCVSNPSSLFRCALANVRLGNDQEARRLERSADDLGMEGYGFALDPRRVELATARGALAEVERLLGAWSPPGLADIEGLAVRLDALIALGRDAEIESEAPPLAKPGTYLEPFALRALGVARKDAELVRQAAERYEAIGMAWHAAETRKLLSVT
jgi:hypothetical protein